MAEAESEQTVQPFALKPLVRQESDEVLLEDEMRVSLSSRSATAEYLAC